MFVEKCKRKALIMHQMGLYLGGFYPGGYWHGNLRYIYNAIWEYPWFAGKKKGSHCIDLITRVSALPLGVRVDKQNLQQVLLDRQPKAQMHLIWVTTNYICTVVLQSIVPNLLCRKFTNFRIIFWILAELLHTVQILKTREKLTQFNTCDS